MFSALFFIAMMCHAGAAENPMPKDNSDCGIHGLLPFSIEEYEVFRTNERVLAKACQVASKVNRHGEDSLIADLQNDNILNSQITCRKMIRERMRKPILIIDHSGDIHWWRKKLASQDASLDDEDTVYTFIDELASVMSRTNQQILDLRSALWCDCRVSIAQKNHAAVVECLENYILVMESISVCSVESCSVLCRLTGEFIQLTNLIEFDFPIEHREAIKKMLAKINNSILPFLVKKSIFFAQNNLASNMPIYMRVDSGSKAWRFAEKTLLELENVMDDSEYFNLEGGPIFDYATTELDEVTKMVAETPNDIVLHIRLQKIRVFRERDFCARYFVRIKEKLDMPMP